MNNEQNGEQTDISVDTPMAKVRAKGTILLLLVAMNFALTCVLAYQIFDHRAVAGISRDQMLRISSELMRQNRELTCLVSLAEADREAEMKRGDGFCKRLARDLPQ